VLKLWISKESKRSKKWGEKSRGERIERVREREKERERERESGVLRSRSREGKCTRVLHFI
jgi:hypothetical protein